jgi:hypothetical protein
MIRISGYIINLLGVLLVCQSGFTQGKKYLPAQFKLGTDLSYLGASFLNKNKNQYEFNADMDFNRFIVTGDYGIGSWDITEMDYTYKNTGSYYRVGIDYNFVKPAPENNAIYVGFKYAGTNFNENFSYQLVDPFYGNYTEEIQDLKRKGMWLEFVAGMKVRIWKGLFLGFTGRLKFASSISSPPSTFNNFWIPGYGKTTKDSQWGLNYQIFYSIPLFKKEWNPSEIMEENE